MSNYYDPEMLDQPPPSACNRLVCYGWKTITFLFSHIALITLVVSYCLIGAKMFETLERGHEIRVKENIVKIRNNITDHLWNLTKYEIPVLEMYNYTNTTVIYLKDFEAALLDAMTKQGWDGHEETNELQWTFEGALFYSIIVITTIGYGHIAPKTDWGKVATIFYAILGIPLMLLCLSNVGDILATSFRFLYWKVCCYVCTKRPKRGKRGRSRGRTRSAGASRFTRSRTASFRRSMRTSTRSADSGFGLSEIVPSSYSDTDLSRYHNEYPQVSPRGLSVPRMKFTAQTRTSETPTNRRVQQLTRQPRGGSLDRRRPPKNLEASLEPIILGNTQVLINKYVVHPKDVPVNYAPDPQPRTSYQQQASPSPAQARRASSMPRSQQQYLEPPRETTLTPLESSAKCVGKKQKRSPAVYSSSPKIMSPMGFGHRQRYDSDYDIDYYDDDYSEMGVLRTKPVPIWLCVLLVLSYIIAGMFLFHYWEHWEYLDAAYFCFITLTTIGFGDFVPARKSLPSEAKLSIALCSLYLLFGIALLAMSFNLVQEEVIAHVRRIAKTLGILKEENVEEEDDEDV